MRILRLVGTSGSVADTAAISVEATGDGEDRYVCQVTVTGLLVGTDDNDFTVKSIKVGGKDLLTGLIEQPWASFRSLEAGRGFSLLPLVGYKRELLPVLRGKGKIAVDGVNRSGGAETFILSVDTIRVADVQAGD